MDISFTRKITVQNDWMANNYYDVPCLLKIESKDFSTTLQVTLILVTVVKLYPSPLPHTIDIKLICAVVWIASLDRVANVVYVVAKSFGFDQLKDENEPTIPSNHNLLA